MNAVLLLISIFTNLISYGIIRNEFCKKDVKSTSDLNLFNTLSGLVSMITLLIICTLTSTLTAVSPYTAFLAVIFGVSTALCALFNMKALETGPLSYTNVIVSCSMVIPALSGTLLYHETISIWQLIGVILMLVSFFCAVDRKSDTSKASFRWLLLCLGAFLFSGAVGVMQKLHQNSPCKNELGMFLIIAFGVCALFSFLLTLYDQKIHKTTVTILTKHKIRRLMLFTTACGIGIALCNQINLYLSGAMEAIIFYPVVNGASMILTAAAGILIWKERLTGRQWFGLITGGAAILLLCNIF